MTQLRDSQIASFSRELSGYFVSLEEFYMEENVKKAIQIDKPVSSFESMVKIVLQIPGSLISSMVDDAFFIFRKSASRSISSRNVPCVCAVLSLMNTLLSKDYMSAIQKQTGCDATPFIQTPFSAQVLVPVLLFRPFFQNRFVLECFLQRIVSRKKTIHSFGF